MSKRGDLSAALQEVAGRQDTPRIVIAPADPISSASPTKPGRAGHVQISGFFEPAVRKQLRQLQVDTDMNLQQLLTEALNDLFEKHGHPRIA